MMTTILAFVFVMGVIVFIHEFGHFITAKATGMRVDEFAIGFGPAIVSTKKGKRSIPFERFRWVVTIRLPVWIRTSLSTSGPF